MEERLLGSILSIISVPVAASYDGGSHSFPHEKDFWLWPIPFMELSKLCVNIPILSE